MKRIVCLAMLCTAVLTPRAALSQEPATSLSLRPFGETTIGLWRRFTPGLEIGLEAGAMKTTTEAEDGQPRDIRTFVTVESTAKLYGRAGGALRPYGAGSLYFSARTFEFNGTEDNSSGVGASLGAGLEWSPVARIRIGGHAGVRAATIDGEATRYDEGGIPVTVDLQGWEASTFTTGLTFYYSF